LPPDYFATVSNGWLVGGGALGTYGKVVLYRGNARDAGSARGSEILFSFSRNRAFESYFSISEDDVYDGYFRNGVPLQCGVLEYRAVYGVAGIVVAGRFGKDFNQVFN
jgi:hypothetical protein